MAEKSSRSKSGMGGKKSSSKSGKKPHSVHVRRGHSGGFIVVHHHQPDVETGASQPDEEHVLPDMTSLQSHMQDSMGDQGAAPAPAPPDQGQAGPPAGM